MAKKELKEIPTEVVPRNLHELDLDTGNIYESLVVISKRAKQLAVEQKQELSEKLEEFAPASDNLEEVLENREQIEISQHYERLPKPTIMATEEFEAKETYWRDPKVLEEGEEEGLPKLEGQEE